MFLELVDAFRCPRPHELSWLVALALRLEDRDIMEGELGCPMCGARYPIVRGVADLRGGATSSGSPATAAATAAARSDLAVRAAALLALTDPGGVAVLAGTWASAAHEVAALTENVGILAIDPPVDIASGFGVSLALASDVLPLRPSTVRAIALDAAHSTPSFLESSVAALRPRGRFLAPASAPLPAGIAEIARDDRDWLGEKIQLGQVRLARSRAR